MSGEAVPFGEVIRKWLVYHWLVIVAQLVIFALGLLVLQAFGVLFPPWRWTFADGALFVVAVVYWPGAWTLQVLVPAAPPFWAYVFAVWLYAVLAGGVLACLDYRRRSREPRS